MLSFGQRVLYFAYRAGRSYEVTSHRTLIQCLESLVQKCQSGVVVSFERIVPDVLTGLIFRRLYLCDTVTVLLFIICCQ